MDDDAMMAFVDTLSTSQQQAFADILEGMISELSVDVEDGGGEVEGYTAGNTTVTHQQASQLYDMLSSVLKSVHEMRGGPIRDLR